ncbi:MAG: hypothetical protein ABSC04_15790 [Syntrophobacteraceae bacterium]
MEVFSKQNATRFFLPKADFQVKQGVWGGAVFFESEPIDLSAYPVFRRHGVFCRHDIFKHLFKREITHQMVCDHVSGGIDPFIM